MWGKVGKGRGKEQDGISGTGQTKELEILRIYKVVEFYHLCDIILYTVIEILQCVTNGISNTDGGEGIDLWKLLRA